jgi:peptidoglycan/LPS O-acetylase OafA/YrhL
MIAGSLLLRVGLMLVAGNWLEANGVVPWRIATNFIICHLDGLAVGSWIALIIRGSTAVKLGSLLKPARYVGTLGVIAMAAVVGISYWSGWRGGIGQSPAYVLIGYTILALMFGALLIVAVAAKPGTAVARIFSSRFLATFGKYSYAVYLLHFPVNLLVKAFILDPALAATSSGQIALQFAYYAITGTLTLAVSWVSWHLLEKHFLKLKDWFPMAQHEPVREIQPTIPRATPVAA